MNNEEILKVIYDKPRIHSLLQSTFTNILSLEDWKNVFDIKLVAIKQSLSQLCQRHLGAKPCRVANKSDWTIRPLSLAQTHAAALDAHALLQIYDVYATKRSMQASV